MAKHLLYNALTEVFKYGFLTGSQVDGTAESNSDWDIVIPENKLEEFKCKILQADSPIDSQAETNQYNKGVKIYCTSIDGIINLIPVSEKDFISWWYTTLTMKNLLLKEFNIHDKNVKINFFEMLNKSFGYAVGNSGQITNEYCTYIAQEAREFAFKVTVDRLLNQLTEENV